MLLSIVVPVYNEAEIIWKLITAVCPIAAQLDPDYELILVNDGSTDRTAEVLAEAAAENPHLKVIGFSRNFGHQIALTAGLDLAAGEAVVIMDADLQDPPELIPEMLRLYREGYDIVSPQRQLRSGDSLFKRATARVFYWVMRTMVDRRVLPEVGDFRLFGAAALEAIRTFREQHRFMRGLIAWLGLREAIVPFQRNPRAGGETHYSFAKMLAFSWTAVTSFSALPLRLCLLFGAILTGISAIGGLYVVYGALVQQKTAPGWASLVLIQCIFSGTIMMAVGLLGDYLARVYDEIKLRPLYVVSHTINCEDVPGAQRAVILNRHTREGRGKAMAAALGLPGAPAAGRQRADEGAERVPADRGGAA